MVGLLARAIALVADTTVYTCEKYVNFYRNLDIASRLNIPHMLLSQKPRNQSSRPTTRDDEDKVA